jgi:sugar/nucleoside kinase (ribokinase family)
MTVSALVLEHGGGEDTAIAALLHDAVEDQGGLATARLIAAQFGSHVGALVMACTDAAPPPGAPKPPWRERKLAFIAAAPRLSAEAALIVTCDKIHNLTCLIRDLQRDGLDTLERFSEPRSLPWYFSSLAQALAPFASTAPVARLQALSQQFQAMVGPPSELHVAADVR